MLTNTKALLYAVIYIVVVTLMLSAVYSMGKKHERNVVEATVRTSVLNGTAFRFEEGGVYEIEIERFTAGRVRECLRCHKDGILLEKPVFRALETLVIE